MSVATCVAPLVAQLHYTFIIQVVQKGRFNSINFSELEFDFNQCKICTLPFCDFFYMVKQLQIFLRWWSNICRIFSTQRIAKFSIYFSTLNFSYFFLSGEVHQTILYFFMACRHQEIDFFLRGGMLPRHMLRLRDLACERFQLLVR